MSQIDLEILRQKVGDRVAELQAALALKYPVTGVDRRKFHVYYVADPAFYVGGEREGQQDEVWTTLQSLQTDRVIVDSIFPPVKESPLSTNVNFVRGRTALAVIGDFDRLDEPMRFALWAALATAAAAHPTYEPADLIFKDPEFYKE